MTGPACRDIRQALGIYVVGAIDPAERSVVDIHLSTCPDCREELAGLAGLPALLGRVPASEAERLILHSEDLHDPQPPPELLNSLLKQVAERRASRRWSGILAAAAAIIIAVAGGAAGARIIAPGGQTHPATAVHAAELAFATNRKTGVSAIVSYAGKSWGTKMDVWVAGIPVGTTCQFWVVDSHGRKWQVDSWTILGQGAWNTLGQGAKYPARASLPVTQLRSFEVKSGGHVLVTVPAS
jgi:hypothetical protein